MRNLDVTTLRSFVAVADLGGVTRAAGFLHLTQSAVSMQLKRLEDLMGVSLLDRSGRGIALTAAGEQMLGYARRMVTLNDEVVRRLTDEEFVGEITLGVPHDIVYPVIPRVMHQFAAAFPRVRIQLVSGYTRGLKKQLATGECDMIVTTEAGPGTGAEDLTTRPLVWIGARGGATWRRRPLRIASGRYCTFRARMIDALNAAGFDWDLAVESENDRTLEATVSADLAVQAMIDGTEPPHLEVIDHGGALPDLGRQHINLYGSGTGLGEPGDHLMQLLRQGYRGNFARRDSGGAPRTVAVA